MHLSLLRRRRQHAPCDVSEHVGCPNQGDSAMNRVQTRQSRRPPPASRAGCSRPCKQLGVTPNFFRVLANSAPQALEGLPRHVRCARRIQRSTRQCSERIALAVAEINACSLLCVGPYRDLVMPGALQYAEIAGQPRTDARRTRRRRRRALRAGPPLNAQPGELTGQRPRCRARRRATTMRRSSRPSCSTLRSTRVHQLLVNEVAQDRRRLPEDRPAR
jgi:hypothetical protein